MHQPLQAWLMKSYLTPPTNNQSVLFLHPDSYSILAKDTFYISQIYPAAREVYSDINSLFFLPFPSFYTFLENKKLTFSHYESD